MQENCKISDDGLQGVARNKYDAENEAASDGIIEWWATLTLTQILSLIVTLTLT